MLLPHSPFVPNLTQPIKSKSKGAKRGSMNPDYFDDGVIYRQDGGAYNTTD